MLIMIRKNAEDIADLKGKCSTVSSAPKEESRGRSKSKDRSKSRPKTPVKKENKERITYITEFPRIPTKLSCLKLGF